MKTTTISDAVLIKLPKIQTGYKGNITPVSSLIDIPFEINRVYYLYDVPSGEKRGGHAHKSLQQVIIAASGSFDLILDDGNTKIRHHLNRPYHGVYMEAGLWRELDNFSSGSVCLVLASATYDETDYIRDYNEFLKYKKHEI